jgi:hypothetical protein
MFCSQCGKKATGKFCWSCGNPLQSAASAEEPLIATDWPKTFDYEALIRVPDVRERIARHAALAKTRLSGEQFLDICDKLLSPVAGGVPLTAIAAITQPLTEKLGMKTGCARSATFHELPGTMLVAILCSLAQNGHKLQTVTQASDGCVIDAQVPSDIWSLAAELRIALQPVEEGTLIDAAVTVKGQYFDWGKSRRAIDRIFSDITTLARAA